MAEVVGIRLKERCETVSVAESCTGGLIGQRLTEVAGSSAYFMEGAITYSNEAKRRTSVLTALKRREPRALSSSSGKRQRRPWRTHGPP